VARRLMTVPGIGPLIATAIEAARQPIEAGDEEHVTLDKRRDDAPELCTIRTRLSLPILALAANALSSARNSSSGLRWPRVMLFP
jgi:hypothetical protein